MGSRRRWPPRVWATLHEPRIVTAGWIVVYGLVLAIAWATATDGVPHRSSQVLASILVIAGSTSGMPAAWHGARWLERPAVASIAAGLTILAAMDLAVSDHWPALVPLLTAVVIATMGIRLWEIRDGGPWAPGQGPWTPLREAETRAAVAERIESDTARQAAEHE